MYQILRVCERFTIDPREWDGLDPAWKHALLLQDRTRTAEEERIATRMAALGGGGAW